MITTNEIRTAMANHDDLYRVYVRSRKEQIDVSNPADHEMLRELLQLAVYCRNISDTDMADMLSAHLNAIETNVSPWKYNKFLEVMARSAIREFVLADEWRADYERGTN